MKQRIDPFRQQLAWDPTQMPCNFEEVTCHNGTGVSCAGHPGSAPRHNSTAGKAQHALCAQHEPWH